MQLAGELRKMRNTLGKNIGAIDQLACLVDSQYGMMLEFDYVGYEKNILVVNDRANTGNCRHQRIQQTGGNEKVQASFR